MDLTKKLFRLHSSRQLKELYAFNILFAFAAALIIIFEPVFFYRQGIALPLIALYYAVHYFLYVLLMPLGAAFAARFGLEKSLTASVPLFVVYFLFLSLMPLAPWLFYLAWIILTLFKIFYWPAYHAKISQFVDQTNRGTEISWFYAIERGVGVSGPILGGLIILFFGFPTLFVIAAGVSLLSVIPLLKTKEKFTPITLSYSAPWRIIASRRYRTTMIGKLGWGEDLIELVFWPIFILMIVGSESLLGIIGTVSSLAMTVFGFFVGEMSDRYARRRVLRLHIPFMIIGYLLRPLSLGLTRVMLTDILAKTAFIGIRVPQWSKEYQNGKEFGGLKYVTAGEMVLAISKSVTAFILAAVFYIFPGQVAFDLTFILAALLSLFYFAV